uniref:Uncharacterized protein n=1 Tax=Anguilla anguilla TaxID=7936 RepID=A0A0E9UBZ7_ANGAN
MFTCSYNVTGLSQ